MVHVMNHILPVREFWIMVRDKFSVRGHRTSNIHCSPCSLIFRKLNVRRSLFNVYFSKTNVHSVGDPCHAGTNLKQSPGIRRFPSADPESNAPVPKMIFRCPRPRSNSGTNKVLGQMKNYSL